MPSLILGLLLLAGCDSGNTGPRSPEERLAGSWVVYDVRAGLEGSATITEAFEEAVGQWTWHFEDIGCCQSAAGFSMEVEGLDPLPEVVSSFRQYVPATARGGMDGPWGMTIDYDYGGMGVGFYYEGANDEVLVITVDPEDIVSFGFEFSHHQPFRIRLARVE